MLTINRMDDMIGMMNYHRTKDMIQLQMFFPELSPIRNLTIVQSFANYQKIMNFVKILWVREMIH